MRLVVFLCISISTCITPTVLGDYHDSRSDYSDYSDSNSDYSDSSDDSTAHGYILNPDVLVTAIEEPAAHQLLRGMVNHGQWCYVNSVLQALLNNKKLYNFLSHVEALEIPLDDAPLTAALVEVASQVSAAKRPKNYIHKKAMDASTAHETISDLQGIEYIKEGDPGDADEVLGFILDRLHDEISVMTGGADPIVYEQFRGSWQEELDLGGTETATQEPFMTITLDALAPKTQSLLDLLNGRTFPELLDNYRGSGTDATKRTVFQTLPPVLVFSLNFLKFDKGRMVKVLTKKMSYPLELEIPESAIIAGFSGNRRYILDAVVHHHGKKPVGHFSASIRFRNKWYAVNDAKPVVAQVPPRNVKGNQVPYLLFYTKKE